MKSINILLVFLLLFAIVVGATITVSNRVPVNLYETTSTSVLFNWTSVASGAETNLPTDLYITTAGGGANETNFVLNDTLFCNNASYCSVTVTGFAIDFYQWYIVVGEDATQPLVTSSAAATFNTTSSNTSLNITYTVNGTVETCAPSLTSDHALPMANVTTIVAAACNVTVANTTTITLTGTGYGKREYIRIDDGTATAVIGFTIGTTYGTQDDRTSTSNWFQIEDSTNDTYFLWTNESGVNLMTLDKDSGDLWIYGSFNGTLTWSDVDHNSFPSYCTSGYGVSGVNLSNVCTRFVLGVGDSVPGEYIFNQSATNTTAALIVQGAANASAPFMIVPQASAPNPAIEGMLFGNSTDNNLYYYNGSGWLKVS